MRLFELFNKKQRVAEDTMQWNIGDIVKPSWESGDSWEPMVVVDVHGLQVTVKDDMGNEHLMSPNDIVSADVTEGGSPGQIRSTKIKHGHKYKPFKHKNKKALGKWQGDDKRDEELEEANPKTPAVLDRQDEKPFAELGKRPSLKRQGQRAGRNLNRKYGIGNPSKNAAKPFDIDEADDNDSSEIKSRDPRITAMLKKARVQYSGSAADDLSALVSMMNDEQKVQDKELDNLDDYNMSQDTDINHTDHVNTDQEVEIGDLAARIDKLEKERFGRPDVANEAITPYGDGEYADDETGEIFRADQVEQGEDGNYQEKQYRPTEQGQKDAEDWMSGKSYNDDTVRSELNPGQQAQAQGMFGDIAAGGGDPIDHLMTELGMSMEEIDALAKENGYNDANEWAESYAEQYEMESIIGNSNKLNNR